MSDFKTNSLESPICLITSLITGRIGRHEGLLLIINHNYNKICDILGIFKLKHKSECFFAGSEKSHLSVRMRWGILSNYLGMTRTVLLVLKTGQ